MQLYDQIKSNFILQNAYEDWMNYRNTLTDFLINETNEVPLSLSFHSNLNSNQIYPTLAILGAGYCNDLDLNKLIPHFSKITLIDYDISAMQTALKTYGLSSSSKIEILPLSFNGIDEQDYYIFCNNLKEYVFSHQNNLSKKYFDDFALSQLKEIYQNTRINTNLLTSKSFDYIWCFGVHSQFQAMFSYIYHVFELNLKDIWSTSDFTPTNRISEYLKSKNDSFIPLFHDSLLKVAKKNIFLGFEQHRLQEESPIEGAYQGIIDIRKRDLNYKESTILWPFSPSDHIQYEMLIQTITL